MTASHDSRPKAKHGHGQEQAVARVKQVTSHVAPPPKPADYSDVLGQLAALRGAAKQPDVQSRGYARQEKAGKLWVRERIEQLVDAGTFSEVGSVSGTVTWRKTQPSGEEIAAFVPSNNVQGAALLRGRKVLVTADDFTIRSGHADGASTDKTIYVEKLAIALRLPVIKLVDGSSGGGSVTTMRKLGASYLPYVSSFPHVIHQLDMGIPNLAAVVGPAIGLGAARAVLCHFSVMAADVGTLFNAGPKVVENSTFEKDLSHQALGGPVVHCANGTIDNLAANEAECYEQLRTVLGYLPSSGSEAPPVTPCSDPETRQDEALRTIIPRRQGRMYNARAIIESVVDRDSWFEIGALWGKTAIGGLARLAGRPVGIISLDCEVNGGALNAAGSQKLARLLKMCDVFNLPILQFLDIPGYAIGTEAERTATMRWGVELAKAYFSTTVPVFNVITRRVYGVAGGIMLGCRDPAMQVSWPSGEWGSLPLEGGIEVAHRHELNEAEKVGKKKELYKELEADYRRLMNPIRTANLFGVEEIIDPKNTRQICCEWASHVYEVLLGPRLADRACGKIRASFT